MHYSITGFDVDRAEGGVVKVRTPNFHSATDKNFDTEKQFRAAVARYAKKAVPVIDC